MIRLFARKAVRSGLIWGGVFGATAASSITQFTAAYDTPQSRHEIATTVGGNGALRALFGSGRAKDRYVAAQGTRLGRTGRAGESGTGITLVLPEQQADVSRVAANLGHGERFEEAGMRVAPPRLVYRSRRGRRSRW